jgi:hypothetical protein
MINVAVRKMAPASEWSAHRGAPLLQVLPVQMPEPGVGLQLGQTPSALQQQQQQQQQQQALSGAVRPGHV